MIKKAIEKLTYARQNADDELDPDWCLALDMAIKALKQEPCEDCISREQARELMYSKQDALTEYDLDSLPSVEPISKTETTTEDCISRQAVLDIAKSSKSNWIDNSVLFKRVSELPSAEPERKVGKWIEYPHEAGANWEYSLYECSECHGWSNDDSSYCPNCGADMMEVQNNKTIGESLEQKILRLEKENKKLKQEVRTLYDEAAEAHDLGVEQI